MKRDEFTSLPVSVALGLIYDMARAKLEPMPRPQVPLPPKFDGRISRKGGFHWMSELVLDDLKWWLEKKRESALGGGEYAERDGKIATALEKWSAWRELYPNDRWRGKRGDDFVTAEAPSKPPPFREWDNTGKSRGAAAAGGRGGRSRGPAPAPQDDGDEYGF